MLKFKQLKMKLYDNKIIYYTYEIYFIYLKIIYFYIF